MNSILLFFVLPISTIILSVTLQKILKCPTLVAATFFAIYLIATYTVFNSNFLIFAIAYSLIAYITAIIVQYINKLIENINMCKPSICPKPCENNNQENIANTNVTLSANSTNPVVVLTSRTNENSRQNCCCRRK